MASWAASKREEVREAAETEDRLHRLALFDSELQLLGVTADEAKRLDDKSLRRAYRQRCRRLHPDVAAGGVRPGEPTIYELNEAYEALRKVLW